ncbi:MAG: hypothetical protein K0Q59_1975, partial [Paenibacillus sp.]|nr:hypothetical protein [Paenibacillus sp.]
HSVPAEFTLGASATGPFRAVTDESLASGGVTVQLGIYALLLVPLLALAFGGYFAAWRMKLKSLREAAVLALIVGIGYSLFLATLALTSDMSAHSSLPRGIVGVEASFRFDPARALLHGFALGALGSLAGCMLRIGVRAAAKELRSRVPYGRPVGMAALAVVAGIGAALLYAGIVLGAKGLLSPIWLAALPQLAIGLWNVAQGNSLQLTDLAANGGSSISVSLFGGISGNGAAQAYGAEWNPYIAAFAVVPAILLVLAGVWLRGARGAAAESNGKALVFGIAYAAFMSLTVSLTEVSAAAYAQIGSRSIGSFALQAGFSLAGTFLVCFIAAYLLSLCGMRIRQHLLDS